MKAILNQHGAGGPPGKTLVEIGREKLIEIAQDVKKGEGFFGRGQRLLDSIYNVSPLSPTTTRNYKDENKVTGGRDVEAGKPWKEEQGQFTFGDDWLYDSRNYSFKDGKNIEAYVNKRNNTKSQSKEYLASCLYSRYNYSQTNCFLSLLAPLN